MITRFALVLLLLVACLSRQSISQDVDVTSTEVAEDLDVTAFPSPLPSLSPDATSKPSRSPDATHHPTMEPTYKPTRSPDATHSPDFTHKPSSKVQQHSLLSRTF